MYNLKKNSPIIDKYKNISDAINKITNSKIKILFVVDRSNKLLGSISSGDLRRSIRKRIDLNQSVQKIMFKKPKYYKSNSIDLSILKNFICIPVVNKNKEIIDFKFSKDIIKNKKNTIFLMAGGKGTRLLPLTKKTPKPLLKIKGVPIIEKIILQFKNQGFKNFIISVNYFGNKIKKYLGDGKKLNVKINYISEKKYLGTVGPLKNLKNLSENFLVINGDTLSNIDYWKLIKNHIKSKKILTVATTSKFIKSEYGIIKLKNGNISKFYEKPINQYIVSMGIYVMNKKILNEIPKNKKFGIDSIIKKLLKKKISINTYSHKGTWIDIGNFSEYQRAQNYKI